jgi:hypothetical protein
MFYPKMLGLPTLKPEGPFYYVPFFVPFLLFTRPGSRSRDFGRGLSGIQMEFNMPFGEL